MEVIKRIIINSWNSLQEGFGLLFEKLSTVLPSIVLALFVLIIGSLIAIFFGHLTSNLIKKTKLDNFFEKTIFRPLEGLGIKIHISNLLGEGVKWFLLFAVLIATFDLAKMSKVITFFTQALNYLPNVFVAVFIMIVGSLLASFTVGLVTVLTKGEHEYLATTAKVSIYAFSAIAAFSQLLAPLVVSLNRFITQMQISQTKSDALFIGIVAFCVLAFGLGCKNMAQNMVEKAYDRFQDTGNGKNLKKKLEEMIKV